MRGGRLRESAANPSRRQPSVLSRMHFPRNAKGPRSTGAFDASVGGQAPAWPLLIFGQHRPTESGAAGAAPPKGAKTVASRRAEAEESRDAVAFDK